MGTIGVLDGAMNERMLVGLRGLGYVVALLSRVVMSVSRGGSNR